MIFIVVSFHLLLLTTHAAAQIVPGTDKTLLMPEQLTGITVGMSLKSFLQIRSQVWNISDVKDDGTFYTLDSKLTDMAQIEVTLLEKFNKDALFSFAVYEFHKGHLSDINIGNKFSDRTWDTQSGAFLSSMIKSYGLPQHIGVTELATKRSPNIKIPILIWIIGDRSIVVRLTPPNLKRGAENIVDAFIGTTSAIQPIDWLNDFLPVGYQEERQIIQPLLTLLGKLVPNKEYSSLVTRIPPNKPPEVTVPTRKKIVSRDFAPTWGSDDSTIYFFTTRSMAGEKVAQVPVLQKNLTKPDESGSLPTYKLAVASNGKAVAFFQLTELSDNPTFSVNSARLSFVSGKSIYLLDTKTFLLGRLNDGYRVFRGMPAWNNKGNEIASSGIHSLSDRTDKDYPYDDDIFVAKVTENLTIASGYPSWCPVRMSGKDILPIFSVDDQWIYFAHQKPIPLNKDDVAKDVSPTRPNWSIYRVKANKHFTENEPAEIILSDIPLPDRLSWFPDGNRLLVSFAQGGAFTESKIDPLRSPIVINTANKTTEKLKLQEMFDPTMPNGKALVPRSIALNVLGDKIVFFAYRWSKNQSEGVSCIYVSNLDGSQLQLVTDPDAPIAFYKYADPTFNISNAWQNLLPKQNLGNPVATKYMNTVDGKAPKEEHEKTVQPAKK